MTRPAVQFRVSGTPVPQGSKRIGRIGKRSIVLDDNDAKLGPWRRTVEHAARAAVFGDFEWRPLLGPVRVAVLFGFNRPVSHPKRTRTWPTGKGTTGDIDKLERAVLDACTSAGLWSDDAQVVESHCVKDWCGFGPATLLHKPGCIVRVWRVVEQPSSGPIPLFPDRKE